LVPVCRQYSELVKWSLKVARKGKVNKLQMAMIFLMFNVLKVAPTNKCVFLLNLIFIIVVEITLLY